ncbi:hypothetical protein EV207_13437 [Scopulibacillus darangshiensis]|uniref:Uncharacterized protein n=1 Tax=Scopulibacillus darangshiensis TaxID=442528 RepID=A0A4R2NN12_9BACL|nr:hypothetical protein [Scopulibacillus darangshiensis]TCP22695.1 hypothetical protein EV207_13437 [Scopulibacillus darangshiensis]
MTYKNHSGDTREYIWVTENSQGTKVALTQDTFEKHVIADHVNDKARELSYDYVRGTIEFPRFIYKDQNHYKNQRVRYTEQVYIEEYGHIQNMVIVVDTDREPNEVATWMVKSSLKQEKINGGMIYDSRANTKETN